MKKNGNNKVTIAIIGQKLDTLTKTIDKIDTKLDTINNKTIKQEVEIEENTRRVNKMERTVEGIYIKLGIFVAVLGSLVAGFISFFLGGK